MSKVLITGGAGFIGSNLAHALADNNEITIVDDLSMGKKKNLDGIKVTFYQHDVCDREFMHQLLSENKFDYIYYLAAVASVADSVERPLATHKINQESVLDTLDYIRTQKLPLKKFLFTSSAAVYGNSPEFPKLESSQVDPLTPYAIDKYAAERFTIDYGKLYGLPTVAVRFFNVYGPRQNPESPYSGVLSIITECMKNNKTFTLFGDGSQTRDFVYVGDVVAALIKLATATDKPMVYNIANGDESSLIDVIHAYEKISGINLNIKYESGRNGDIDKSKADISKLKSIGFTPKWTLENGLREYWKYYEK
ncbi:NAD-dependent epimerase/dehydratase family protein [Limosilactobacillus caviae]|uniref:Epimerase n=1 Tax=Limosilactobacillus caviae TaxID=1769424 RepID=A0ABQ2C7E5_9LACO|nr:NAD-dependent epimerase/dehydratase family protein [Limosilactobacillus caviae]MCD7124518.1 NAD-dependent epimerase/dehydratase family protein [Limosilactobacillus caviae]MRH47256.1 NAD-dependent epimerase/dehydratase family protein [Limosilactobacillus reuteri]GGI64271.1 epimerase [Limosilactobacillus caviae]